MGVKPSTKTEVREFRGKHFGPKETEFVSSKNNMVSNMKELVLSMTGLVSNMTKLESNMNPTFFYSLSLYSQYTV